MVSDTVKIVMRGTILGVQKWSIGLWASAAGASNASPTDCAALAALINGPLGTWATAVKVNWTASTVLTGTDVYAYPAGQIHSTANGGTNLATPVVGTGSSAHPSYVALCCTLLTAKSGRSYRGRNYVPYTAGPITVPGMEAVAGSVTALATAHATLIRQIQGLTQTVITNCIPVVASFTKGIMTPINSVRVDSLCDTQHRREDKMTPTTVGSSNV